MRFKQKLALLICGCVLVLSVLCLIQYRLVQNTYRLEKSAYFQQVERQLGSKSQGLTDTLNNQVMRALLSRLQYQIANGIQPHLVGFQQEIDQRVYNYRRLISQTLLKDSLLHGVAYSLQYTQILLYHSAQTDTLLQTGSKPLLLAGMGSGIFTLSEGKQQVGFHVKVNNFPVKKRYFRLTVWNRPSISAVGWQQTVLRRMFAVLACSAALIAALIFIFFMIFSALLRQKKIADVTTDFANNMTHELKTPLSAAALVVKSMRTPDAKLDEKWYDELLGQLDRQHGKIRRLMDNVLTSALERPVGVVQLRQIKLKTLLEDLTLLATASGRELTLTGQIESVVCTDPDLLAAILSNLLDNAFKYTPPKSSLCLNIRETSDGYLIIGLEDQGAGIERKYQRYLFRKFFRVPQKGSGRINGLGLGLYISQMQAFQLNGKLVYEPNPGGGSIFNLILPYGKNTDTTC